MITFDKTTVLNFENALRGARNPMNSWAKSDSYYEEAGEFVLGENDLSLATRLCKAGPDHRKFMRQILVSVDIDAPLYWWKEFDTYKVGTVANSTSTMHKLHAKPFTLSDFSHDQLAGQAKAYLQNTIDYLNDLRETYLATKEKAHWYAMVQLLPSSYHQLRTCTMNYENLLAMYHARKHHKLDEWRCFCDWVGTLPYASALVIDVK